MLLCNTHLDGRWKAQIQVIYKGEARLDINIIQVTCGEHKSLTKNEMNRALGHLCAHIG